MADLTPPLLAPGFLRIYVGIDILNVGVSLGCLSKPARVPLRLVSDEDLIATIHSMLWNRV